MIRCAQKCRPATGYEGCCCVYWSVMWRAWQVCSALWPSSVFPYARICPTVASGIHNIVFRGKKIGVKVAKIIVTSSYFCLR